MERGAKWRFKKPEFPVFAGLLGALWRKEQAKNRNNNTEMFYRGLCNHNTQYKEITKFSLFC